MSDDFVNMMLKKSQEREKTEVFKPLSPTAPDKPENSSLAMSQADMDEVENIVRKLKEKV